jgi:hypothetical protein
MIPPFRAPLNRKAKAVLRLTAMALITLVVSWAGWLVINNYVPPQDLPWAPLDLEAPVGHATQTKLTDLEEHSGACFALLDRAGVEVTHVDLSPSRVECVVPAPMTLDRSLTPYSATLTMSCPLAAALHVWERNVVLPEAERLLGSKVVKIETFGSYSCRRVNHRREGNWSEHARGAAIDISGFLLEDGRRITVKTDFRDPGPEGQFLRSIRDKACRVFRTTLSPDYNALHRDHLHLDMGRWKSCN